MVANAKKAPAQRDVRQTGAVVLLVHALDGRAHHNSLMLNLPEMDATAASLADVRLCLM